MKQRTLEISVGVFMILAIASLLMLALRVSGLSDFYSGNGGYTVSAVFNNIGGLKIRSKVTIGGVRIGKVDKIKLYYNAKLDIYEPIVVMRIDSTVSKIPTDSHASILTAGLLGDNYIGIDTGHEETYLSNGEMITITTQALLLEDLISKFAVND
jgi:phospholipid/cholesterol/gamma-HCH transport system substrate-binding protein